MKISMYNTFRNLILFVLGLDKHKVKNLFWKKKIVLQSGDSWLHIKMTCLRTFLSKTKFANSKHFEHKISGTRQNDDDHKWGVVACLQDVLHNVDAKTFKYHQLKKVL